jgi:hypothetical protein
MSANEFKLRNKPVSLGTVRPATGKSRVVTDLNQRLTVPTFTTTLPSWPGASYIAARLLIQMGFLWSFRVPITAPSNTFVAAIKWTETGSIVRRYKLWQGVGELLSYPLYSGELIPAANAVLEIWSVEGQLTPALATEWNVPITLLELPDCCCDTESALYALDAMCLTHEPPITDNYLNNLDEYFEHCPVTAS